MIIRHIEQLTDDHCGPAVLEMLLEAVGIEVTQEQVVEVLGVEDTIEEHGTRVDQLGEACKILAPEVNFWYKYRASLDDIRRLLSYGYAVGVEWQGLFYDSEEEEEEPDDDTTYGHYSIVTFIDDDHQQMIIVDPYKDFADQDRIFPIKTFLRRWWDTNEIRDPFSGRRRYVDDEQLLFFIAPKGVEFSPHYGFKRYTSKEEFYGIRY